MLSEAPDCETYFGCESKKDRVKESHGVVVSKNCINTTPPRGLL